MSNVNPGEKRVRQRVSVACLPCRQKRIRCDGALPVCTSCTAKAISCEYNFTDNKRKPPSKAYVQALEGRIRCLEEQLSSRNEMSASQFTADSEDASMIMSFDSIDDSGDQNLLSALTGLMGRFNIGDDGQLHYFGSQSNYHLMNSISDKSSMESTVSLQRRGLAAVERMGKNMPLSVALQEHLLELYWTWQHPWNYIIHKEVFSRAFRSRTYDRYCTPLLLSAIFALACRFSDCKELRTVGEDPNTAGSAFFEQAKILFLYESQAPIIATVQAAALMSMRALSDGQEALGWLYCGNAVRMALNLGLNIDCSQWVTSGLISEDEAEVRKVTWWGCFVLDKLFSIAVGRPGCTRKSHITCPKPSLSHEVEFEPWNPNLGSAPVVSATVMPSRAVSTGHYAAECLSLASEAMDQIYAPNSGLSAKEVEDVVARTDVELRALYLSLPSHLRLPPSLQSPIPAHIYQLHMQYHVNLILLHRPLLEVSPGIRKCHSTLPSWQSPHIKTCRESASEVVKLLRSYNQHYTLRYASLATVQVAFTAAIVHLADIENSSYKQHAIRDFETCLNALEEMRSTWSAWSSKALREIHNVQEEWSIVDCLGT
ncbi:fungal-specific transcription factor domain-containing protein [Fusarium oxysporum]|nr:fungal-specific transcription factor domain-containing protein [Fusarium oxysporum]